MQTIIKLALWVPPLLFAVIAHEYAHGRMAERLGDPTARIMGRLTFNPLPHIDLMGSIIFPLLLFLASGGSLLFGWAKPVPINPYNLKNPKRDMIWISLAGPGTNIALAIACGLLLRVFGVWGLEPAGPWFPVYALLLFSMIINLVLGLFNLIPIPPLDGSKVVAGLLPYRFYFEFMKLERYGLYIILGVILAGQLFGVSLIGSLVMPVLRLFIGIFAGQDLGAF